jgi:hypothetical protein
VNNYNYAPTGGSYRPPPRPIAFTAHLVGRNPERAFDICPWLPWRGAKLRDAGNRGQRHAPQERIKEDPEQDFSLIEAISPCTTLFASEQMKQTVACCYWLKKRASPRQFAKI